MTIVIFIAILILLVLVHEFGHFFAAKLFGVKVEEFGIGFPPRIWGIKKGETVYSLNWLLLGGFVRIFGEEGEGENDPRSYANRPAWQRAVILGAGVFGNIFLTFIILWIGFTIGFPTALGGKIEGGKLLESNVQIVQVVKGSPAEEAKIKQTDIVLSIKSPQTDSLAITDVETLQTFTKNHRGEVLTLTIRRGGEIFEKNVLSRANPPEGEGQMGIALAQVGIVAFPWYEAIGKAFTATWNNIYFIFLSIYLLIESFFTEGKAIGEVSGPVGIAVLTGQFYALGINYFLAFVALISINLAVLNILPIPALDGGRLFFLIIEKLKGSPLRPELENRIHAVGFALLLGILIIVTVRDILHL